MLLHLQGNFSSIILQNKVLSACADKLLQHILVGFGWWFVFCLFGCFFKIFFYTAVRKVTWGNSGLAETARVRARMSRCLLTNRSQAKRRPCGMCMNTYIRPLEKRLMQLPADPFQQRAGCWSYPSDCLMKGCSCSKHICLAR